MFIDIKDNVTGICYFVNSFNICYFYNKINQYGKCQYIIALVDGKEITVTHKKWNKIKNMVNSQFKNL